MKTIIITGASSGIGKALAIEYADKDIKLILIGRNKTRLEEVSDICKAKGAEIAANMADVTNKKEMENIITSEQNIDLIIANAGISGGTAGGEESSEQIRKIFSVNIEGVLNTILPAIPLMKRHRCGQIAVMSSLSSFRALPGAPSYSASKAAVRFYGEALRGHLLPHNIKVNVICPGYIKTPMTDVNKFPMPLIISAEKAAKIIRRGLEKNRARIAFPWPMYFLVWLLGCFSPTLTDWLFTRLPKKG